MSLEVPKNDLCLVNSIKLLLVLLYLRGRLKNELSTFTAATCDTKSSYSKESTDK